MKTIIHNQQSAARLTGLLLFLITLFMPLATLRAQNGSAPDGTKGNPYVIYLDTIKVSAEPGCQFIDSLNGYTVINGGIYLFKSGKEGANIHYMLQGGDPNAPHRICNLIEDKTDKSLADHITLLVNGTDQDPVWIKSLLLYGHVRIESAQAGTPALLRIINAGLQANLFILGNTNGIPGYVTLDKEVTMTIAAIDDMNAVTCNRGSVLTVEGTLYGSGGVKANKGTTAGSNYKALRFTFVEAPNAPLTVEQMPAPGGEPSSFTLTLPEQTDAKRLFLFCPNSDDKGDYTLTKADGTPLYVMSGNKICKTFKVLASGTADYEDVSEPLVLSEHSNIQLNCKAASGLLQWTYTSWKQTDPKVFPGVVKGEGKAYANTLKVTLDASLGSLSAPLLLEEVILSGRDTALIVKKEGESASPATLNLDLQTEGVVMLEAGRAPVYFDGVTCHIAPSKDVKNYFALNGPYAIDRNMKNGATLTGLRSFNLSGTPCNIRLKAGNDEYPLYNASGGYWFYSNFFGDCEVWGDYDAGGPGKIQYAKITDREAGIAKTAFTSADTENKDLAPYRLIPENNNFIGIVSSNFFRYIGSDSPTTIGAVSMRSDRLNGTVTLSNLTITDRFIIGEDNIRIDYNITLDLVGENRLGDLKIGLGSTLTTRGTGTLKYKSVTNNGTLIDSTGQLTSVLIPVNDDNLSLTMHISGASEVPQGGTTTLTASSNLNLIQTKADNGYASASTYQWEKWENDLWNKIDGAASSTYNAGIGKYRCLIKEIVTIGEDKSIATSLYTPEATVTKAADPDPDPVDPDPIPPVYYSVTIPSVEGAVTNPVAGTYEVESWDNFRFYLTLDPDYDQSVPVVTTSRGETITPRQSDKAYLVKYVRSDVNILIDGICRNTPPVANETMGTQPATVYRAGSLLHITSPCAADIRIYSFAGSLLASKRLAAPGTLTLPAPSEACIVVVGNQRFKVAP